MYNSVIVRFSGEIAIKSRGVRNYWEKLLVDRIRRSCGCEIIHEGLRVFIPTEDPDSVIGRLRLIFGLHSFSPAIMTGVSYVEIRNAAFRIVEAKGGANGGGRTFAIIVDKNLSELDSDELKRRLGSEIVEAFGLRVNLSSPDIPVHVEIRRERAFVFSERIPGPGGLPLGTQDDLVVMYSGGPDSSLAAWYAMRRGSRVSLVYLDFGGEPLRSEALERAVEGAKLLSRWGGVKKLYVVDFDPVVERMRENAPSSLLYLLFKRYMLRVARLVAKLEGAQGIVTGEIIGEQASQTVRNLALITEAVPSALPVFRPVLCFDKEEVLKRLKEVDEELFRTVSRSVEPCKFLTVKPRMNVSLETLQSYEAKIGVGSSTLKELVAQAKVVTF